MSAFYADGGSFSVSSGVDEDRAAGAEQYQVVESQSLPAEALPTKDFGRPDNRAKLRLPGAGPAELLNLMMRRRPPGGLLETPPEKFPAVMEEEAESLRNFFLSQAGDDGDYDE